MNNKIISIGFFLLILSSCKDFLIENPEVTVAQTDFYKSQGDFEQAVIGAYAPLRNIYNTEWQMTEMRSDNTFFIYDVAQRGPKPVEDLATFTVETNNAPLMNYWQNNYLVVSRANQVLVNIDKSTFGQAAKDNLKGQALFLRALAYFNLLNNFGGVPLFVVPPGSYEETFKTRAAASDISKQVIDDAGAAASLLPSGAGKTDVGRVTSGAAQTLLADMYLTLGVWSKAETALRSVLTMGYSLLPDYSDIYKPSNKGNNEIIFQVNFLEATSQPMYSTFPYAFLPDLADPGVLTGIKPETRNGDGSFNTPTPDIISAYEDSAKDKRFAASIGFFTGPSPLVGVTYNNTPYIKKYLHPHALSGQTNQNWIVYRYAEVLLMLAECLNEQNKPGEALPYINMVRRRAGLPDLLIAGQAELRNKILNERRIELAFENKRWHDLVRKNLAVEVMNAFGAKVKANPGHYYYAPGNAPPPNAFNVDKNDLLYPIPVTEIVINPELQQNPGY
jgi:hypothetical protein